MRRLDLTGKRFGHLTVTGAVPSVDGRSWWACKCDCGLTCQRQGKRLTMKTPAGWVHSCGCRAALAGRIRQKFVHQVDARLRAIHRS
jgi:hypothetical protein